VDPFIFRSAIQLKDISIDTVEYLIKMGRLNGHKKITVADLHRAMPWNKLKNGFRLESTADSKIDIPIHIEIQAIDPPTVRLIEAAGGKVECKYYSKRDVDVMLHPSRYFVTEEFKQLSLPKYREDILNYADKETRGYLSNLRRAELARLLREAPSYTVQAKDAAEKEAAQIAMEKAEAKKAKMRNRRKYR
jgi:large subunit ribosomal protein L15